MQTGRGLEHIRNVIERYTPLLEPVAGGPSIVGGPYYKTQATIATGTGTPHIYNAMALLEENSRA